MQKEQSKMIEICARCGRELKPDQAIWLDLNSRTGEYTPGTWRAEESAGSFAFGSECIKRVLSKDELARFKRKARKAKSL